MSKTDPLWLLLLLLCACTPKPCPDGCSATVNVVEAADIHAPCPESKPCKDYLVYAEARGRPVRGVVEAVEALHRDHEAGRGSAESPVEDLRAAVIRATGLTSLLEGLDERPLEIREVARRDTAFGQEIDLRIRDPIVGRFSLLMLRPEGDGPFPGVLALPGHGDSPAFHRDRYLGVELAEAGFVVLIVGFRNHGGDLVESATTRQLLASGTPFVGVRVYEALLAHKVLRWHPEVIPERLSVMGHSGGADIASVLVRVEPMKLVIDHQTAYLTVMPDGRWLDDTAPGLHRIHRAINDVSTLPMGAYQDDYEYTAGPKKLVRYLR
jgi:hypothetical protein